MKISEKELKELAVELYDVGIIKYGNFQKKNGGYTPIYFDLWVLISYPRLLYRLSMSLWNLMENERDYTHVCGVPFGALSIAQAISFESNKPMLMKRKEAKTYGMKKAIEGHFEPGDKPLVIEDVMVSGSSIMEAVRGLRDEGLVVDAALVVVDKDEDGTSELENAGIRVTALFTMTQLIGYLYDAGKLSGESVQIVADYLKATKTPLKAQNGNCR